MRSDWLVPESWVSEAVFFCVAGAGLSAAKQGDTAPPRPSVATIATAAARVKSPFTSTSLTNWYERYKQVTREDEQSQYRMQHGTTCGRKF